MVSLPGHRRRRGADRARLRPDDLRRGHRRDPERPLGGRARAARPDPRRSTDQEITDVEEVFDAVGRTKPGDTVTGDGAPRGASGPSRSRPHRPGRPGPGAARHPGRHRLRLPVRRAASAIDDSIGGPSAGLIFSLSVYDTLTPGRSPGARSSPAPAPSPPTDGGPDRRDPAEDRRRRGGRGRAVPGAAGQLREARCPIPIDESGWSAPTTMSSAVEALETYTEDPSADLPRCTA